MSDAEKKIKEEQERDAKLRQERELQEKSRTDWIKNQSRILKELEEKENEKKLLNDKEQQQQKIVLDQSNQESKFFKEKEEQEKEFFEQKEQESKFFNDKEQQEKEYFENKQQESKFFQDKENQEKEYFENLEQEKNEFREKEQGQKDSEMINNLSHNKSKPDNLSPQLQPPFEIQAKYAEEQRRQYEEHKLEKTIETQRDLFENKHARLCTPEDVLAEKRSDLENRFDEMREKLKEQELVRNRQIDRQFEKNR